MTTKVIQSTPRSKADPEAREAHRKELKRLAKELELPLFPRSDGRWAKKVNGSFAYFGKWTEADDGDWQAALDLYERHQAARDGSEPDTERETVSSLWNKFLNAKRLLVESGELSPRTFYDYEATAKRATKFFGRKREIEGIRPAEWAKFRASLAKGDPDRGPRKPISLKKEIVQVRMVSKWGAESGLIEHELRFGPDFKVPKQKTLRTAKAENGSRAFESRELRTILAASKPALKAMILLGVNAGFGQSDCARLPFQALDLQNGWVTFPRPKTGVNRRAKLWPETIDALQAAIAERPEPKRPDLSRLVFITQHGGAWVKINAKGMPTDSVGQEFAKLIKTIDEDAAEKAKKTGKAPPAKLRKPRRSFYGLRHTFETVSGEATDQVATDFVMGHAPRSDDMGANYRHGISDARLENVANVVRAWLFPADQQNG